jgi:hypothetical protein
VNDRPFSVGPLPKTVPFNRLVNAGLVVWKIWDYLAYRTDVIRKQIKSCCGWLLKTSVMFRHVVGIEYEY